MSLKERTPQQFACQGVQTLLASFPRRNDQSNIQTFAEGSTLRRPSLYGCTTGAGISGVSDACEEQEPRAFGLQVPGPQLQEPPFVSSSYLAVKKNLRAAPRRKLAVPSNLEICFEEFWKAYPKKVGKGDARKAWKQKKPDLQKCLDALAWQVKLPQWEREEGQYIPYPGSWLRAERWDDERKAPKTVTIATRSPNSPLPDLTPEELERRRQMAKQIPALLAKIGRKL